MKKSSFERTLEIFYINMYTDLFFLVKIENAKRVVASRYEKRGVLSAYVFSICANWEILAEDLIIDLLNKDMSKYKEFTGFKMRRHFIRDECKAILFGTDYFDFRNIEHLKGIAKNILTTKFNPFPRIPKSNGRKIDEFFSLRNYLAHYSDKAKRELAKMYKNTYGLKTFREPGDFLLSIDKEQNLPRMDIYIDNFIDTADIMAKHLGVFI